MSILTSIVFAPACIVLSFLLGEVIGYPNGLMWLSVPCFLLAAAGIVSLFFTSGNDRALPSVIWWAAAVIALVNAGSDVNHFISEPAPTAVYETVLNGSNSYSYGNNAYNYSGSSSYSGAYISSGSANQSSSKGSTCSACSGSGKCHVCRGIAKSCQSMYCSSGRCTSCRGTGIYTSGSRASTCLVCHGDGKCDTCKGTNVHTCSLCRNDRICDYCGGDGKR